MKYLISALVVLTFLSCKKGGNEKDSDKNRVDIYLAKSYKIETDTSAFPPSSSLSDVVLSDTILVKNDQIVSYDQKERTFKLKKGAMSKLKAVNGNSAFALTVNNEIVYYGKFQPGYLSYILFNVATIDPLDYGNNELPVGFSADTPGQQISPKDKRNSDVLLDALKASGRLK